MTTYDFSPLYRSTVGFDRLARVMDAMAQSGAAANGYPPYNIAAVGEDHYRVTMAVAGFSEDDLSVEVREQTLVVEGKIASREDDVAYLHRGISERDFVRKFQLADHVKVKDARLANGLLVIDLEREIPEEMKPRTIKIGHGKPTNLATKAKKLIEGDAETKAA
jgi:molecular chaperone IbpA